MTDSRPPEQLRAADLYDATREHRIRRCLRGVALSDGPLTDMMAALDRARRDPDNEAEMIRDRED